MCISSVSVPLCQRTILTCHRRTPTSWLSGDVQEDMYIHIFFGMRNYLDFLRLLAAWHPSGSARALHEIWMSTFHVHCIMWPKLQLPHPWESACPVSIRPHTNVFVSFVHGWHWPTCLLPVSYYHFFSAPKLEIHSMFLLRHWRFCLLSLIIPDTGRLYM